MLDIKFAADTMFITGSGKRVTFTDVIQRISKYLEGVDTYSIDVGTDSQTNGGTKFVTAIMVCQKGKGGIFFYCVDHRTKMRFLRDRIYEETRLSIECANVLIELLLDSDLLYDVAIHCDLGESGKTRELIREIVGYVTASGFDCKIKPDGVAACSIADKFSK